MPKKFTKPTPEQVTQYADSIGFALDGEAFCDFYEAKGWKIGTTPMKCWMAAVRNWKRRQKADGTFKPSARDQYLKEAVARVRAMQQYVRAGAPYQNEDPKEAMRRYWSALRDKHGPKFIDELKAKLN